MNAKVLFSIVIVVFVIIVIIGLLGYKLFISNAEGDYIEFDKENEQYVERLGFEKTRELFDTLYVNEQDVQIQNSGQSLVVSSSDVEIGDYTISLSYTDDGNKSFDFTIISTQNLQADIENMITITVDANNFKALNEQINDQQIVDVINQFKFSMQPLIAHDFGYQPQKVSLPELAKTNEHQLMPSGFYIIEDREDGVRLFQKDNYQIEFDTKNVEPFYTLTMFDQGGRVLGTLTTTDEGAVYTAYVYGDGYIVTLQSDEYDISYPVVDSGITTQISPVFDQLLAAGREFEMSFYS